MSIQGVLCVVLLRPQVVMIAFLLFKLEIIRSAGVLHQGSEFICIAAVA